MMPKFGHRFTGCEGTRDWTGFPFKQDVTSKEMVQRSGICSLLAAESHAFEAAF